MNSFVYEYAPVTIEKPEDYAARANSSIEWTPEDSSDVLFVTND